jgi:hypothetical protein
MRNIILVIALMGIAIADAATEIRWRNLKLPSQSLLQNQELTPAAADDDLLLNDEAVLLSGPKVITSFLAQPDVPRNIVVTPGGTTNDIAAGSVVIEGINVDGAAISENIALANNQSTAVVGNKAFAKISKITIPQGDGADATLDIGTGEKIGLIKCMDGDGFFIKGLSDGSALSGATVASNATALESNTVIPDPAPNGSRKFTFLYIQNYRCAE